MRRAIDLRVLELLAARLCHDLIGPVTAIANGIELMADDDGEFGRDALTLVADSSRQGGRRLQFYRFAWGFGGGGLTGAAPHALAADFFSDAAIDCDYGAAVRELPPAEQKLACAMLAVAGEGLPRGGRMMLSLVAGGLQIDAVGAGGGLSPEAVAALALSASPAALTTRTVAAYVAGLLAEARGRRLVVEALAGGFRVLAAPL
ncbi:MAG TPA: histidine phosphotransferase family protein [Stellaceae bacterium]|nr:histidine phosphotransferase family protein [Stellaceae bacterium]